jgi:uncharacterized protein
MQLDPLYIQVLPRLNETGSSESLSGVLPLESIAIGFRQFKVLEGISYEVQLSNTSEAILASGRASALLSTSCDRCLETCELKVSGEIEGYYLFEPSRADKEEKLELYEQVDETGRIDLAPPILAAIVFELPTVTLCKPDCGGVQEELEQNSDSSGPAGTAEPTESAESAEPAKENPFSALKDFKFE